jgi:hypothetical protein
MKKQFIKEPVYESYFYLVWDCSVEKLREWVEKRFGWELDIVECHQHLGKLITIESEGNIDWVLWINKKTNYESLSHELLHLTFNTMKRAGVTLSDDSEEAFTYLFGYYMRESLKVLR